MSSQVSPRAFSGARSSPAPVLLPQKSSSSRRELQEQIHAPRRAANGKSNEVGSSYTTPKSSAAQVEARKALSISARMARVAAWDTAPRICTSHAGEDGGREPTSVLGNDGMQSKMDNLASEIQAFEDRLAGQESQLAQIPAPSPSSPLHVPPPSLTAGAPAVEGRRLQSLHVSVIPGKSTPPRQSRSELGPSNVGGQQEARSTEVSTLQLLPTQQAASTSSSAAERGPQMEPPICPHADSVSCVKVLDQQERKICGSDDQRGSILNRAATLGAQPLPPIPAPEAASATNDNALSDARKAGVGIAIHEQEGKIVVAGVKKGSRCFC